MSELSLKYEKKHYQMLDKINKNLIFLLGFIFQAISRLQALVQTNAVNYGEENQE